VSFYTVLISYTPSQYHYNMYSLTQSDDTVEASPRVVIPGGQSSQLVCHALDWYVPRSQDLHMFLSTSKYWPAVQLAETRQKYYLLTICQDIRMR